VAICGAAALRRLDRRASAFVTAIIQERSAGQNRLVIVGATGMVGGYALRYALENPAVRTVTSIGRRKLGISHPKLREILHGDFADCSALAEVLSTQSAAVFCLGAYTGAVSYAELRSITVDYTIEFARVLRRSSPHAALSFLSGSGADPTGRSRVASHATREKLKRRCSPRAFLSFTFSDPPISTPWSRERNRTLVTACSARSIQRFGCCFPTR